MPPEGERSAGAAAHHRALEALYRHAPVNRLFDSTLEIVEPGFARMEAMKFQRVVVPGTELDLSLDWHAARGVLGFRYQSSQGAHASGRIVFAPQDLAR